MAYLRRPHGPTPTRPIGVPVSGPRPTPTSQDANPHPQSTPPSLLTSFRPDPGSGRTTRRDPPTVGRDPGFRDGLNPEGIGPRVVPPVRFRGPVPHAPPPTRARRRPGDGVPLLVGVDGPVAGGPCSRVSGVDPPWASLTSPGPLGPGVEPPLGVHLPLHPFPGRTRPHSRDKGPCKIRGSSVRDPEVRKDTLPFCRGRSGLPRLGSLRKCHADRAVS